jgi:hypothetical protein
MLFDVPFAGTPRQKIVDPNCDSSVDEKAESDPTEARAASACKVFGVVKHYPPKWWSTNIEQNKR